MLAAVGGTAASRGTPDVGLVVTQTSPRSCGTELALTLAGVRGTPYRVEPATCAVLRRQILFRPGCLPPRDSNSQCAANRYCPVAAAGHTAGSAARGVLVLA